jgi:hypothetical protein
MTMLGLRRIWGIRPGELVRPLTMLGRGRLMGEPKSGPRGRGRIRRLGRLRGRRGAP